jgi:hypothetical protein
MKKPDHTFEEQSFDTAIGQKSTIKRKQLGEGEREREVTASMNNLLKNIGQELNFNADNLECMGSMAIHIYASKALKQVFYVSQLCLGETPEIVASKAFEDLRGTVMKSYGRNRPKRRSGF